MAAIVLGALGAAAQSHTGATRRTHCNPIASTSFRFGLTGGTLRPTGWHIATSGVVSPVGNGAGTSPRPRRLPRQAVRDLARRAWTSDFPRLPTAPTHPTRNPDAARQYIDIRSACGAKHVEYASGEGAPAFRELYSQLEAFTQPR